MKIMRNMVVVMLVVGVGLSAGTAWCAAEQSPGKTDKDAQEKATAVRDAIVDALWVKIDEYWHSSQLEPIIPLCRQVIELDPQDAEAYGVAGWVSMQLGKDEQAIEFYEKGMTANPNDWDLPSDFGLRFYVYHKKDVQKGLVYLKRAAELPSPIYVKRAYGHMLTRAAREQEQAGNQQKAREYYKQAAAVWHKVLASDPNDRFAKRELERLRKEGKISDQD
jgi:tetratricopeptide (TPR) repeat protein